MFDNVTGLMFERCKKLHSNIDRTSMAMMVYYRPETY